MCVPSWGNTLRGLALVSLLGAAAPAWAADPTKIANDLMGALTASGGTATFGAATAAGADVSISDLRVTMPDGTVEIGTVLIVNPVDRAGGGFTADRMAIGSGRLTQQGDAAVSWATGEANALTIPSPAEVVANPASAVFTSMSIEGMTVEAEDLSPFPINRFDMSLGDIVDGTPQAVAFNVIGIELPPEALEEMGDEANTILQGFGIEKIVFSVGFDAAFQRAADTLDLRSFSLDIDQVGKIALGGRFSGVPLSKLQSEEGMEELAGTATIDMLSLRFENHGIVEKILDMQAQQTGLNRAQLVAQLTGAMPFMLGFLGDPALQQELGTAFSAFLADPQSVTLNITPKTALLAVQAFQAVVTDPTQLLGIVSISAVANN